jgi:hypothetical protein
MTGKRAGRDSERWDPFFLLTEKPFLRNSNKKKNAILY